MKSHTRRHMVQRLGDERGATLVEAALSVLLIFLLLGGAFDLGRAFNNYVIVANAAREGARYASFYPWNLTGILGATKLEAAGSDVTLADGHIVIDPRPPAGAQPGDPGVAQPGQSISVEVQYPFQTFFASVTGLGNLTLRSRTKMVVFGADMP